MRELGWLCVVVAALMAGSMLSGCAGVGFSGALYRIDEHAESQATKPIPMKCLFVNCGAEGEGHGS